MKVSVADIRVGHEVKLMEFTKWLERPGGPPREVIQRKRIRSILGMPVQDEVRQLEETRKDGSVESHQEFVEVSGHT